VLIGSIHVHIARRHHRRLRIRLSPRGRRLLARASRRHPIKLLVQTRIGGIVARSRIVLVR